MVNIGDLDRAICERRLCELDGIEDVITLDEKGISCNLYDTEEAVHHRSTGKDYVRIGSGVYWDGADAIAYYVIKDETGKIFAGSDWEF
jgi:hypothetical protein